MSDSIIKNAALAAAVATTLAIPVEASAAFDMFVKIDGIEGESKHKGEIDVLSWSWGLSKDSRGKVCVQDLSLVKYVDSSTPGLAQSMPADRTFSLAELKILHDGSGRPHMTIVMKDVLVSSYQTGGSGGEDRLTENVTLNFSEVEGTYFKYDSSGGPATQMKYLIPYSQCK